MLLRHSIYSAPSSSPPCEASSCRRRWQPTQGSESSARRCPSQPVVYLSTYVSRAKKQNLQTTKWVSPAVRFFMVLLVKLSGSSWDSRLLKPPPAKKQSKKQIFSASASEVASWKLRVPIPGPSSWPLRSSWQMPTEPSFLRRQMSGVTVCISIASNSLHTEMRLNEQR